MSERPEGFRLGWLGGLLFARSLPGLAAIMLAAVGQVGVSAACLVVAALLDLAVDSYATRRQWLPTPGEIQIEGFVDFACFVWAPVQIALAVSADWFTLASAGVFIVAGGFRLARFNVLGMTRGGYLGLPVTYSGVAIPIIVLIVMPATPIAPPIALTTGFLVLSPLMISRKFVTPRASV